MVKIIGTLSAAKRRDYLLSRLSQAAGTATRGFPAACLIVPEQFMFETERLMYTLLGPRKIVELDITGFTKLAADTISKYGEPKLYADDIVKAVTMYKTLSRLRTRLVYYKGAVSYELAAQMLSLAADFKGAGILPDTLRDAAVRGELDEYEGIGFGRALTDKLTDISEIYSAYCETLEYDFADKLDDNRIAAGVISFYQSFEGVRVFIHEFDSFTASQIALVRAIAESADSVEILLRTDCKISDVPALSAMNALINRLEREFEKSGIDVEFEGVSGADNSPQIEMWTADNITDECDFIAQEIRRLITREGYTCNEIAVLQCSCAASDTARLKEAFAAYDLACYTDLPEPMLHKPLTRFLICALEAISLDTPRLLSYMRSGFVRVPAVLESYDKKRKHRPFREILDGEEFPGRRGYTTSRMTLRLSKRSMDLLERAAFRYALKSREWGKPFPDSNAELSRIEPLRKAIVTPLLDLKAACRNTTGDKITEAVCIFLLDTMQLHRSVLALCAGSVDSSAIENKNLSEEFRQLWDLLIDVFESLHVSLTDEPLTLSEYLEILRGVCSTVNIAKPPQVLDAVAIGDVERSRFDGVKVAFIAGANAGAFPRSAGNLSGNVFSGKDVEVLSENGLEIMPGLSQRYNYERFLAEKALTLPSEKLYITAPLSDAAWRELSPSPVFAEFPIEVKQVPAQKNDEWLPLSRDSGNTHLAEHSLTPETAQKLFRMDILSPTAIETMMSCRFKFFCERGLRLDVPLALNEDEPIALERGNIIHHCLDTILRNGALFTAKDDELQQLVLAQIHEYRSFRIPAEFARSKRQTYILQSFAGGIVRMLKHIRGDFERSGFRPHEFEKKIDFVLGDIRLSGKIDRVDKLSHSGQEYVRVVDYKSGKSKLDLSATYYGLNLQMLLYLFAEAVNLKPSSALYLPSDGAAVEGTLLPHSANFAPDVLRKHWLKAHKPGGIVVADGSPAYADFAEWESRFCAESNSKKGFVNALSPTGYERLKAHCTRIISEGAAGVLGGGIPAIPTVTGERKPCDYCEFGAVCGVSEVVSVNQEAIREVLTGGE